MFNLIFVVLLAGLVTSIGRARENRIIKDYEEKIKNLQKTNNFHNFAPIKEITEKRGTIIPLIRSSKNMDILDIMESICEGDTLDHFSLVHVVNERAKYQYLQNGYYFTIYAEEDRIQGFIKKDDSIVLEFDYDCDYYEFDKKKFSRSVMNGKPREEALEIIENFFETITEYEWYNIEEGLEIIDDVKAIEPFTDYKTREETTIHETLDEVDSFTTKVKEEFSDNELKTRFLSITENIQSLSQHLDQFDLESKHLFENLLSKDVHSLLDAYIKLEDENKENYRSDVLESLTRIESKMLLFKERIENGNVHEVNKIIEVIKKRY